MYRAINEHIRLVLNAINPRKEVTPYENLAAMFAGLGGKVSGDVEFRRSFKYFWAMNSAFLTPGFQDRFFQLLQERHGDSRDPMEVVRQVAVELYHIETQRGRYSLQFSFATKLVHTINPRAPVHDSNVRAFYLFSTYPQAKSWEQKLERLMRDYEFLVSEYKRIIDQKLLATAISAYRAEFEPDHALSNERVIDALVWSYVSLLQRGQLRPGYQ
jgi:hypothetical protein